MVPRAQRCAADAGMGCAASSQQVSVVPEAGSDPDESAPSAGSTDPPASSQRSVTFASHDADAPAAGAVAAAGSETPEKPKPKLPVLTALADTRSSKTSEYQSPAAAGTLSADWSGVLTMKLVEAQISEDEDTEEWALTRMETLCRLSPLRLARKVMDQNEDAIDQETFLDHTTCAVLFIDYSRVCELTTALFKKQGIFVRPKSLAAILNTHLGQLVDRLTRGGGDIIKFAGDALLVAFPVTEESDLSEQTLRATQLSVECIAELEAAGTVEGVVLTAHSGVGVGDATGFLVGGVFNRSEYAFIGDPVYQAASAEVAGSHGETVISAEGWALLNGRAEGTEVSDGCWVVTSIKEEEKLQSLDNISSGQKVLEAWTKRSKSLIDEIRLKCKDRAGMISCAEELKHIVPGAVRNQLPKFTPSAIPSISELRFVTVVLVRVGGLDLKNGGAEEITKTQRIVKLIQETVYVHDGNFMRFSVDDLGAVAMGIFGLPPSHENDPELSVGCGIDICRQVQSRSEEFGGVKASVGIASGYCWLGLVGGVSRCEYTIQGPTNSTAARLMCATEDGVMTDVATRDACLQTARNSFVFESKPLSVLEEGGQTMPGLLRSSSNFQAAQQRVAGECYLASHNPSAKSSSKQKNGSKDGGLVMKINEDTVDAESDTQEWAVKRLEVLSRLAPYRLLRHVIAQHEGQRQRTEAAAAAAAAEAEAAAEAAAAAASSEASSPDSKLNQRNTLWIADICDGAVAKGVSHVEGELAELFARYGTVDSVTVREKHDDLTSERETDQSWALVTFDLDGGTRADLEGAMAAHIELEGKKLWVEIAKARKELRREGTGALASVLEAQSFKTKSLSSETDQQSFYDRTTCAAMFIDISGFSKITRLLFAKHGLEGVEVLASTLNTYLGRMVDRLTQCGGDVIKFAGDAALVIFTVTEEADLARQTLKAVQLSLECIADLEDGEHTVEGIALTAHTGIGVGDATGFLVGGVFNRSEYAIIGEPVFQIASAEPAAGDGETVISPQAWELIKDHAEGRVTTDDNWLVSAIKPESMLDAVALGHGGGILDELAALTKEAANLAANEIKTVVPGGVRNRLPDFTPDSMPCMSEFRLVTMLFARIQGLDYSRGDAELKKIQSIVKIIQQTIYTHDGIFLRFSVDDKGAVVMGCYGLPPSHANDPERGVMASLDFSRQIHTEHKDEFDGVQISVGLTTGYCWLGLVGGVSRCEYTTHAPMINLAARLMCSTDDQVTVDLATKEACETTNKRAKFDSKEPIMAKGFDEPVKVFVPRLVATTGLALKHWASKTKGKAVKSKSTHPLDDVCSAEPALACASLHSH